MALRNRLRRLQKEVEQDGVLIRQRDGTVKVFGTMQVYAEMFLASVDLFRKPSVDSEVLAAVRNATPESRASFEARFGPIEMTGHVIASGPEGGWVKVYALKEDGTVIETYHEGGSAEAERVRQEARRGAEPWT